jgi:hypothetical protein
MKAAIILLTLLVGMGLCAGGGGIVLSKAAARDTLTALMAGKVLVWAVVDSVGLDEQSLGVRMTYCAPRKQSGNTFQRSGGGQADSEQLTLITYAMHGSEGDREFSLVYREYMTCHVVSEMLPQQGDTIPVLVVADEQSLLVTDVLTYSKHAYGWKMVENGKNGFVLQESLRFLPSPLIGSVAFS